MTHIVDLAPEWLTRNRLGPPTPEQRRNSLVPRDLDQTPVVTSYGEKQNYAMPQAREINHLISEIDKADAEELRLKLALDDVRQHRAKLRGDLEMTFARIRNEVEKLE